MNRRHVHQKPPRQRNVAGNPRALLAERFLRNLNDHVLPGLQHLRNQLRPPRRAAVAAVMPAVVPRAPGTTPFESRTTRWAASAVGTSATAVRPATAAVGTTAAIVAATVPSAAAKRPLESRTRIPADARGIPRKLFTRSRSTASTRRARLAGEQNHIFLDDCRAFSDNLAGSRRNYFRLCMFVLFVFVLV